MAHLVQLTPHKTFINQLRQTYFRQKKVNKNQRKWKKKSIQIYERTLEAMETEFQLGKGVIEVRI
jgi:hypothetical protein